MPLFNRMPTGSRILSPLYPRLTQNWTYDGFGWMFEDGGTGFLAVFNCTDQDRMIEYKHFSSTPTLKKHSGYILNLGNQSIDFGQSYPLSLGAPLELLKNPSLAKVPLEGGGQRGSNGTGWSQYEHDGNYITHATGGGRRSCTWPPIRGVVQSADPATIAAAWQSIVYWNSELWTMRPLGHQFAPNEYSKHMYQHTDWFYNASQPDGVKWGHDGEVNNNDLYGSPHNCNSFDPAHNETTPQYIHALGGGRLGVCILWILQGWLANGQYHDAPKGGDSWQDMFSQERGIQMCMLSCARSFMLGFEWCDPDLQRDWFAGLPWWENDVVGERPGRNGGLGYTPRAMLRGFIETLVGPEYGGRSNASSRYMWRNRLWDDGTVHIFPRAKGKDSSCSQDFTYNGVQYKGVHGNELGFHRLMLIWGMADILNMHDYIETLNQNDPLIDLARISEIKRWHKDFQDFVFDQMLADSRSGNDAGGAPTKGRWRYGTFMFEEPAKAANNSFQEQAAVDDPVFGSMAVAIPCDPTDKRTNRPWQFHADGIGDWGESDHLFLMQYPNWAPGLNKWYICAGAWKNDFNSGPETTRNVCGAAAYAMTRGYDDLLQAQLDQYPLLDPLNIKYNASHVDIMWRVIEDSNSSPLVLSTVLSKARAKSINLVNPAPIPIGTVISKARAKSIALVDTYQPILLGTVLSKARAKVLGVVDNPPILVGTVRSLARGDVDLIDGEGNTHLDVGTVRALSMETLELIDNEPPPDDPPPPPDDGGAPGAPPKAPAPLVLPAPPFIGDLALSFSDR